MSITATMYTVTISFVLRVIKRSSVFTDLPLIPIVSYTVAGKKNLERKKDSDDGDEGEGEGEVTFLRANFSGNKYEIHEGSIRCTK